MALEVFIKKRLENLQDGLDIHWVKQKNSLIEINDGNWYSARQDRRHDIAIVGSYRINQKWTLSCQLDFLYG